MQQEKSQNNQQENKPAVVEDTTAENLPALSDTNIKEIIDHEVKSEVKKAFIHVKEQFSGPLPHPKHMEEYRKIDKSLPDRIVKMAEDNHNHQMCIEKRIVFSESNISYLGWFSSTAISFFLIYVAYDLIKDGKSIESLVSLLGGMAPLIATFIFKTKKSDS